MFKLVIASLLVVSAFALPCSYDALLNGKIVAGFPIDIEEIPYQVSLQYLGGLICGGSIISPFYVITAAQCTDGSTASQLSVRAGSNHLSRGVVAAVATIFQHPSYDDWDNDYDISVLFLNGNGLPLGPAIQPIALPQQSQPIPGGVDAIVSGWGTLRDAETFPTQLQAAIVLPTTIAECRALFESGLITDRMMCAVVREGDLHAFPSDSGGPLVIAGELIGIVSWSYGYIRPDVPSVYTSVPALRNFITQITGI